MRPSGHWPVLQRRRSPPPSLLQSAVAVTRLGCLHCPTPPAHAMQAVLCGDVLATGWFCAERGRIAEMAAAQGPVTVAVLGLGPVGLMAVVAARELGAAQVRQIVKVIAQRPVG